jgi:hypothetical protein
MPGSIGRERGRAITASGPVRERVLEPGREQGPELGPVGLARVREPGRVREAGPELVVEPVAREALVGVGDMGRS